LTADFFAKSQETGEHLLEINLGKEDKDRWLDHIYLQTIYSNTSDEAKAIFYNRPGYISSGVALKDTWLSVGKFDNNPFSAEQNAILKRFAKAFGLAYTRFLDLQKAEAQAREAQIETALEKVRSRSLAMHKSDELQEVIQVVFDRLYELGIAMDV